jgi:glycosyltransferase involved in cell wall biosynthesis
MLFPTFWIGEGFPGVLIDALISGLPVLASNWNLNQEIIEDNETGFIFKAKDSQALYLKMRYVLFNKKEIEHMRINCINRAIDFHSETVLESIEF